MNEQRHGNIWIRWATENWREGEDFPVSIQINTLTDKSLSEALFILHDARCFFVSTAELQRVLLGKPENERGTILFRVNPQKHTIDGEKVKMDVIISRTHRRKSGPSDLLNFSKPN